MWTMLDAETWLSIEITRTAARLSAICFVVVATTDLKSKILLGRFAHDEALLLLQACARLDELSSQPVAPATLGSALGETPVLLPLTLSAYFLKSEAWTGNPTPLPTSPVYDEPTHRLRETMIAVRARQRTELGIEDHHPTANRPYQLSDLAQMLAQVAQPGRPKALHLSNERVPVGIEAGSPRAALFQQNLVNLEIPTIEMCCALIVGEAAMPLGFVADMARQAWDEARHAWMFWTRLNEVGGTYADYPASTSLWSMCRDQPLAVKLAIHQCFGEWIGVDGAAWFRQEGIRVNDLQTAALFDAVLRDEIGHVRVGHRWLRILCNTPEAMAAARATAAERRSAAGRVSEGPLSFPLDEDLCRACGFSEFEVAELVKRYQVHGSILTNDLSHPAPYLSTPPDPPSTSCASTS